MAHDRIRSCKTSAGRVRSGLRKPPRGENGASHPGPEEILETYYSCVAFSWATVSLDYQRVRNPAYNTDRGPVSIFAVRVHAQF
jgi:hypothetical protein